ncbi:MAG: MraY family glycosyltransferase [Burkholderiales bacterium]
MHKLSRTTIVLLILLAGCITLALVNPKSSYTSKVVVKITENLYIEFLQAKYPREDLCQDASNSVVKVLTATCATCTVIAQQCLTRLDKNEIQYLGEEALMSPSARLPRGVIVYKSSEPSLAMAACTEGEKQAAKTRENLLKCDPPNVKRTAIASSSQFLNGTNWQYWITVALVPFAIAFLVGWALIRYESLHSNWSTDHVDSGPQKFHAAPTPRIGGICIAAGLLTCAALLPAIGFRDLGSEMILLLVAGFAPFAGGLAEDLVKRVGILERLLFTMVGAAIASWLLGATLPRVDVPGLDWLLAFSPFAVVFTVFAVSGVSNSINIIDGFNGLAAGFSVLVALALAYVAFLVGDATVFPASVALVGALIGFLCWNYPKGLVFLGDGGAYLVGFWLAELSVLLVVRNPQVSPWFPLLLLTYPVFETLFSSYRRVVLRRRSPGHPDGLHLHTLFFRRVVGRAQAKSAASMLTRRNNRVAPQMLLLSMICIVPAIISWQNTGWLIGFAMLFCCGYWWLYSRISRWNTPGWIRRMQNS